MGLAIQIDNLSKAYQLGQFSTGTLSRDMERWWALFRGKEDPFLKIGETNDRSVKGTTPIVWSLQDINFQVQQGEILGIIGKNGAGKSTLLKILSRVTSPTLGTIKLKGRVASLLEVGTGFHPELTGRENIYLNGSILGMLKREISQQFDEIVHFSGVERYIDTPVKRYSSGMYVRLAFAVAAHLQSEILIVDEVLAVGDADFQKKCIAKMGEVSDQSGRTVLFVSHNMASVRALCNSALYLRDGSVVSMGATDEIISQYLSVNACDDSIDGIIPEEASLHGTGEGKFRTLLVIGSDNVAKREFYFRERLKVKFQFEAFVDLKDITVSLFIVNMFGQRIATDFENDHFKPRSLAKGIYEFVVEIDETLMPGEYSFGLSASFFHSGSDIDFIENFMRFTISKESNAKFSDYPWDTVHGYFQSRSSWEMKKLSS